MPASTDLVSIDHAKDWAKRLHKSKLSVATLSSAQEAVAVMLGHASWHALDAFYKNASQPSGKDSGLVPLPPGEGAIRPGSTEACDMQVGPCACGSWHNDTNPPARLAPIAESLSAEVKPFDDMMQAALDTINRKFPGLNGTYVEVIAHETDELECSYDDLTDKAQDLENNGYFPDDAMDKVIQDNTVTIKAPPGHLMIRVRNADNQAFMTIISAEEYGAAFKGAEAVPKKPKMS